MALLTQSEYARHRKERALDGATHTAVQRALDAGRIAYEPESKLIDPDKADQDWRNNTEPRPAKASKPVKKNSDAPPADADYNLSRAKREFYDSELARLKVEEKRGKLISATIVRKVLFEAGKIIRAGHEDIVSQLAPDLASETVISAVERILKTRFDRLDTELASRIEKLDESLLVEESDD